MVKNNDFFNKKSTFPPFFFFLFKTSVAISSVCFAHLSPNIHPCPSEALHGGHSDGPICWYFPHPEPSSCGEHLPQNQSNNQVNFLFAFGCRLVTFLKDQTILPTSTPPPYWRITHQGRDWFELRNFATKNTPFLDWWIQGHMPSAFLLFSYFCCEPTHVE